MRIHHSPRSRRALRLCVPALLLCVSLLMFHGIALAAASPLVAVSAPASVQLGADFSFSATFDSSGTTGYGPFIDLIFPATGADGNDGITFTSATYLGQPVTTVTLTFPAGGCVAHPYAQDTSHAALQVCGTPGNTLVVIQLPFGSFTPAQPPATVTVNAHMSDLADLGTALTIRSRGGFQFGNDALDNPCCDPSIVNPSSTSSATWPGSPVTPTLLTLTKTYLGPEDETATGPNYPRQYRIDVDIAPGQTVTNLRIQDQLPNNVQFVAVNAVSGGAVVASSDPSTTTPGGLLSRTLGSVTGTTATNDASLLFTFYVPLDDSTGGPVLNAASGDDALAPNNASALGDWTPKDNRDPGATGNAVVNGPGPEHTLTAKSIAIQKGVALVANAGMAGYSVGDTLEYTLQFQVSDYFAFENVVISDTISDGQRYDSSFQPTLTVSGNGFTLGTAPMSGANITVAPNYTPADPAPNDGTTTFTFRVSDELLSRGRPNDHWIGGCVQPAGTGGPAPDCGLYNDGATTATLRFRTIIQDTFSDIYPSGDPYVDSGDHLDNAVTITGDLLSVANTTNLTGLSESDTSGTSINIVFGSLSKSIYAINGSTSFATPVQVTPGDTVTYRIQYSLASSDFENLRYVDNLPLPIFDATQITPPLSGAAIPPAGKVAYGPADTYHTLSGVTPTTPAITTSAAENSLTFDYGTFNDPANRQSTIDLLFTVTVSDQPFADRLFLTNQVHESDGSTNGPGHQDDAIVQLQLTEPVLRVKKGVIGSDHAGATLTPPATRPLAFSPPGSAGPRWSGTINSTNLAAAPIDSNISGVDTGDLVSYAIVIENTGTSQKGAFDVTITDTLPVGLVIPSGGAGLNMRITYGDGSPLTYVPLGPSSSAADLFANGIKLDDPASAGACQKYDPNNGKNIIVITYDLKVDPSAPAGVVIPNRASIVNYAGDEGGPNFVPVDHPTDIATTTVASPGLLKRLTGTEINNANNSSTQAVIGELVNYTLTITVPEGVTSNARIVDTLDSGLAFVDVTSVTTSAGLSVSTPIGVGASPANVTVSGSGGTIAFNPGTITNSDTDNTQAETIAIAYRAVVLDVIGNQNGTLLNNSAALTWANGALPSVSAANVAVIEPVLDTAKSVVVNGAGTSGDAGDPVVYTIVIQHTGASTADAFDVTFSDPLPKASASGPTLIDNPTFNVVDTAGLVTAADFSLVGNNATGWTLQTVGSFDMSLAPAGRLITITINGTLSNMVTPGSSITNSATTLWTSLDGAPGARSTYNANSTERTGAGGVDDYTDPGAATLTIFAPNPVKTIVATSEPYTGVQSGVERVTIGEIVRYRLEVRLAEGTSPSFQLFDRMDAGLRFLNDGTAKVAFVSNGGGISSSDPTIAGAGLNVAGNSSNVAPTFVLPDAAVSINPAANSDTYNDGTDVYFKLGNLTNNDSDSDSEYVVIEFNLLVDNITSSQAFNNSTGTTTTTTRNNDFQVLVNGSLIATSTQGATNQVRIAEPLIRNLTKTVTTAPGDAGDTAVYTLTFGNTASGVGAAPAFDVIVTDILNANLSPQSVTGSTTGGACGATASTFSGTITGQTITGNVTCLNPGGTATMVITARVVPTAPAGQIIPNAANLTYTSLPGTIGTCSNPTGSCVNSVAGFGTPGGATGERDGSNGTGGLNDYVSASSTVNVILAAPTIDKLAPSPTQYTIGDQVTYDILVTLPEGVTRNLVVFDDLPAGLSYVGHQVIITAAASGGQLAADYGGTLAPEVLTAPGGSGGDVTLSFGDTTTTDDNNTGNNRFLVRLTARVLNVFPGNQDGVTLTNSAAVRYTNPNTGATATVNDPTPPVITLIEPRIATTKSVTPNTNAQAGTVLTYAVRFTNTGNSTAYDVTAIDTLAQGTSFTALSGCVDQTGASVPASATPAGATVAFDGSPAGSWDIPATNPDSYIECTYTVTAQSNLYIDGSHTNTIDADWSSQDSAANPQDRAYDDSTTYPFDATQDTASATFTVNGVTFGKSDNGTASATIGSVVNYTLTITSPLGTVRGLVVGDTLPAGLIYNGSFSVNGISTVPVFSASAPNDGSALVNLTWNFGDAVVTSSPATITFNATVANVLGNQQSGTRTNSATLDHRNAANVAQPTLSSSDSFTIVEPVLALNKRILTPASPADAGGVVTYQVTITNTTGANISTAYDTRYRDTLPPGTSLNLPVSISTAGGASGVADGSFGNTVDVTIATLPPGGTVTIQYAATLISTVTPGQTINNTGDVIWSSLSGADANERHDGNGNQGGGGLNDYRLQSSASFTTANNPTIDKALASTSDPQTTGANVTIGETLTYTLGVTLPEGIIPALTVVDNLPPGLAYVAGSATLDITGFNGSVPVPSVSSAGGSGDDVTFGFGAISVAGDNDTTNNRFLISLQAQVLDITGNVGVNPPGQTSLPNSATLQIGAGPLVPSNSVTATVVEPRIVTTKSVVPSSNVQAGSVLNYTVRFANNGTSTAYDTTATDTLAPGTMFTALIGCVDQNGGPVAAQATDNGATVDFSNGAPGSFDIPAGGFVECTYTVTARSDLVVEGSHINTIDADWASQNDVVGERIYDDTISRPTDGTQDTATATFTTGAPAFGKSDGGVAEATIGEKITYTLSITSPTGLIRDLVITDTLPAGLIYDAGSYSVNGISTAPVFSASAPNDGSAPVALSWDFGDATITASPARIVFFATVANVVGNQQGQTLTNSAALDHDNAAGVAQPPLPGSDSFQIVEPALAIAKSVTPLSANAGDLVTFRIAITNTATIAAFDVLIADSVPNGLTYEPGSIRIVGGPAGATNDAGAPSLSWSFASIPASASAVAEFDARLDGTGLPATPILNTAGVTWTSQPGANPNERTGAGGPLNDYEDSSQATLSTAAYEVDKKLISPAGGLASVNDTVRFGITITNTGATALATVPLTDSFDPAFLQFLAASAAPDATAAGLLTWNDVGPLAPGATRTITVDFKTLAATNGQPGGVTINRIGVSGARDGNGTPLASRSSSATVAIGAPDLRVSKTDGQTSTTPGATLIYTINVTNTGNIAAAGVVITETLPANTSFAGGSVAWALQGGSYIYALPAPLAPGQATAVTFAVTVDTPLPAGVDTLTNAVGVGDDGTHGADATPSNNSASDVDDVDAAPDLQINKSDGGMSTTAGGVVTYTLTYTNAGNQGDEGVLIIETVPANTTFDVGASPAGWSCFPDGSAGSQCIYTVGDLAAGASGSVAFVLVVDDPLPAGVTQIDNTADIVDDEGNGADLTPGDNTSSDTTPVAAAPDLLINKTDGGITTTAGGVVTYTLTYTNAGDQDATGVVITETVPVDSSFNAPASAPTAWSCVDGAAAGTVCTTTIIKGVASGATGSVTFAITVDSPLPAGVTQIANSATIGDDGANGADPTPNNNTGSDTTPISAAPDLRLSKSDGGSVLLPGAPITYTLSYVNVGPIAATGVVITETVPTNTRFNTTASLPTVWSCADGAAAGTVCTTAISGAVAGNGGAGSVRFVARIDDPLPPNVAPIINTARIGDDGANGADPTPANNVGSATTSPNPTALTLLSFSATRRSDGVRVRWETGAEFNTWGFYLYRSTDTLRSHAVRVTPEVIPARGRSGGAVYTWDDATVTEDATYFYWLQEVELNGRTNEYGPAKAAERPAGAPYQLFLPLIVR